MAPAELVEGVIAQVAAGGAGAPVFGLIAGAVLSISPVALPTVPVVSAVMGPALGVNAPGSGRRRRVALPVAAFVVGMDAPLAVLGYLFVGVTVAVTRASVVVSWLTALLLSGAGLYVLFRRGMACRAAADLPREPWRAFAFGVVFSVTGCPGCAPIVIAVGSAAALVGGPAAAVVVLAAFLVGRAVVLLALSVVAGAVLTARGARFFDVAIGLGLLLAAGYYAYTIVTGQVTALVSGERGSGVLPG
ncbi:MAG: cytochrome c biogenesis protein CcdA [Nocardioidaceae bacterium]